MAAQYIILVFSRIHNYKIQIGMYPYKLGSHENTPYRYIS